METLTITTAEIIDALKEAGTAPKHAKTVADLSAETGCPARIVRRSLHALHAAGRLRVHRVERIAIDGRRAAVPAYTVVPAKRKR